MRLCSTVKQFCMQETHITGCPGQIWVSWCVYKMDPVNHFLSLNTDQYTTNIHTLRRVPSQLRPHTDLEETHIYNSRTPNNTMASCSYNVGDKVVFTMCNKIPHLWVFWNSSLILVLASGHPICRDDYSLYRQSWDLCCMLLLQGHLEAWSLRFR